MHDLSSRYNHFEPYSWTNGVEEDRGATGMLPFRVAMQALQTCPDSPVSNHRQ